MNRYFPFAQMESCMVYILYYNTIRPEGVTFFCFNSCIIVLLYSSVAVPQFKQSPIDKPLLHLI